MVLFYDLTSGAAHSHSHRHQQQQQQLVLDRAARERLNGEHGLARLLAAYPFLAGMARWLDHTDLENLSGACWQFRENMGPYRGGLLRGSLRCCRDDGGQGAAEGAEGVEGAGAGAAWGAVRAVRGGGRCVRDMVRACRRCERPYCRNCIYKPKKTTLVHRLRHPCLPCRAMAPNARTPRCACTDTTWVCPACAEGRIFSYPPATCLICGSGPLPCGVFDVNRRNACMWCRGVVWSRADIEALREEGVVFDGEGEGEGDVSCL